MMKRDGQTEEMVVVKTMRPFGGPDYRKNERRCKGGEYGCVWCGRPIKDEAKAVWVEVLVNGKFADDAPGSAESQGCFPMGPSCAKLYRAERSMNV